MTRRAALCGVRSLGDLGERTAFRPQVPWTTVSCEARRRLSRWRLAQPGSPPAWRSSSSRLAISCFVLVHQRPFFRQSWFLNRSDPAREYSCFNVAIGIAVILLLLQIVFALQDIEFVRIVCEFLVGSRQICCASKLHPSRGPFRPVRLPSLPYRPPQTWRLVRGGGAAGSWPTTLMVPVRVSKIVVVDRQFRLWERFFCGLCLAGRIGDALLLLRALSNAGENEHYASQCR